MKLTTMTVPHRTRERASKLAESRKVFKQNVVDLLLYAWEFAPEDVRDRATLALARGEVGERMGKAQGASAGAA